MTQVVSRSPMVLFPIPYNNSSCNELDFFKMQRFMNFIFCIIYELCASENCKLINVITMMAGNFVPAVTRKIYLI